ncbi:hypothetical protein Tco_0110134 [Tanacetum coccineum]
MLPTPAHRSDTSYHLRGVWFTPISPSPSIVPLPVSSPMILLTVPSPVATPATTKTEGFLTELGAQVEMQGGLIRDHAVRLEELSPALFKRYDRDIRELFTRSGAVWMRFSSRGSWAGQTDAQRVALWYAISDSQGSEPGGCAVTTCVRRVAARSKVGDGLLTV